MDPNAFPDLVGQRQAEMLGWLQEAIQPQMAALAPDLDPVEGGNQMARGAYQRLADSLPSSSWALPADQLRAIALKALDRPLLDQLLTQVRRALVVSTLTVRSYDVQEDILIPSDKAAQGWKLDGGRRPRPRWSRAPWAPTCTTTSAQGDHVRLANRFHTSFPIARLYRLQLSVKADKSWNRLRVFVEKQGKLYQSVRDLPMADANWTEFCWQEPGPDDLTNKIRTWVLLKPVAEGSQYLRKRPPGHSRSASSWSATTWAGPGARRSAATTRWSSTTCRSGVTPPPAFSWWP